MSGVFICRMITKEFSKVGKPIYTPISNGWGFDFLPIFLNTWYYQSFKFKPLYFVYSGNLLCCFNLLFPND